MARKTEKPPQTAWRRRLNAFAVVGAAFAMPFVGIVWAISYLR